ncbi:DUF1054 family protein [Weissella diestrammenae]|uniref:DUF1054 family protein n=1 Tax=Weissella diestrammenae TaxID=1162633 RepID=A0A7G9T6C0_9LACO|nr:DUF1054 family protein [Weissella diestrammenae]MCM0583309.1 DUF1054 family protein [Weissella diestrammenae]QNN75645.1 DUF1054 family protein [Weissella diestrammenae]
MFTQQHFDVFSEPTLHGRMTQIRSVLDPEFELFAEKALPLLEQDGQQWTAHVAKHLRRTVNPPESTWIAFSPNRRGYKMMPHFELTMWQNRLFMSLSVLENAKETPGKWAQLSKKIEVAQDLIAQLPADFVSSKDHMVNEVTPIDVKNIVQNFTKSRQNELIIGMSIDAKSDQIGTNQTEQTLLHAIQALLPIYAIIRD